MKHRFLRVGWWAPLAGALIAASCGSDPDKIQVRDEPDGGDGGGGAEQSSGGAVDQSMAGTLPRGGDETFPGGAPNQAGAGGQAGMPGASGAEAANGGAAGADAGGAAGADAGGAAGADAGGAAGADAGGAAGSDNGPDVTVDAGCLPPATPQRLSPAAAGLPEAGLALWLRADRGIYATAQHRVCAWVDQSGNDNVFYANGQNRALWTEAGLGAQPAIDIDAAGRYLSVAGVLGIPATSGRTLIAVVQLVSTTGRFAAVMQGKGGTAGTYVNLDTNTFQTAGSREGVYVTNNSYDSSLSTSTSPRVHVFTVSSMVPGTAVLAAIDYRVNGAALTLTRNAGGLGNSTIEDFSPADFTLVGSGTRALIAEAIVYGRALTLDERGVVEAALKGRYGIP